MDFFGVGGLVEDVEPANSFPNVFGEGFFHGWDFTFFVFADSEENGLRKNLINIKNTLELFPIF